MLCSLNSCVDAVFWQRDLPRCKCTWKLGPRRERGSAALESRKVGLPDGLIARVRLLRERSGATPVIVRVLILPSCVAGRTGLLAAGGVGEDGRRLRLQHSIAPRLKLGIVMLPTLFPDRAVDGVGCDPSDLMQG